MKTSVKCTLNFNVAIITENVLQFILKKHAKSLQIVSFSSETQELFSDLIISLGTVNNSYKKKYC